MASAAARIHRGRCAGRRVGLVGTDSSRGMHLHSCLVYNSGTKQIVGVAGAVIHYRYSVSKKETRMQRLQRNRESE